MKTLLTGLFVLGLTIQSFAQSSAMTIKEVKLDNLVLSPSKNVSYINTVETNKPPREIQKLESEVGTYDITKSSVYKNNFDDYEVLFNNTEGNIIASYDHNGKLINAFEKFENTPLPDLVRNAIHYKYPGWTIHSTVYRVNYYNENHCKEVYNVQIKNNDKKLNLKVSPEGEILNHRLNK